MFSQLSTFLFQRKYERFWSRHADRGYMRTVLYPAIGRHLQQSPTRRVLDVGCQWYSVRNRDFFGLDSVEYWVVDIVPPPAGMRCDHFVQMELAELPRARPELAGFFDVIFSFGVLGYVKFNSAQVRDYLDALHRLLQPGGLLLLKLDPSKLATYPAEYRIDPGLWLHQFVPARLEDVPEEKVMASGSDLYHFYTLRKVESEKELQAPDFGPKGG